MLFSIIVNNQFGSYLGSYTAMVFIPWLALALSGVPAWPLRPCTPRIQSNCTEGRFVPCGTHARQHREATVPARDVSKCRGRAGQVQPGRSMLMQFTSGPPEQGGECLEIHVEVGECWGMDSDRDSYDCIGRCGIGCQEEGPGLCSNWSRNCLKHDICSYYFNSRGGVVDPNCGWAFQKAEPDFLEPCLSDASCTLSGFNTKAEVCHATYLSL